MQLRLCVHLKYFYTAFGCKESQNIGQQFKHSGLRFFALQDISGDDSPQRDHGVKTGTRMVPYKQRVAANYQLINRVAIICLIQVNNSSFWVVRLGMGTYYLLPRDSTAPSALRQVELLPFSHLHNTQFNSQMVVREVNVRPHAHCPH